MIAALAWLACQAPPPAEPPTTAAPPSGDTDSPTPPPPDPRWRVEIGPATPCTDEGRDERFFDPIDLGPHPEPSPTTWTGAGVAIEDFDGDGRLDLFATGTSGATLFLGRPGGWEDATAALAGLDLEHAVGAVAADFDGDGDPDLLVTRFGRPSVLLRTDPGGFVDVTAASGLMARSGFSASATWADLDGDGWLDLAVGNYGTKPDGAWGPLMPPGDASELWRNRGDGTFEDLSDRLPDGVHDAYTFMTTAHDVDGDGLPELFHVADFGWIRPSSLLWNRGGFAFEPDDGTAGFHPNFAGMGVAVGDLNDDGLPDFAQTSFQTVSLLLSHVNPLATRGVTWVEHAGPWNLFVSANLRQVFGWGAEFGDLDNDGDLDLVMGFGDWSEYPGELNQVDGVWLLDENRFQPAHGAPRWQLADAGSTRGVLLVDVDGDGWLDVVKRILGEPLRIHRSRCGPDRHWTQIAVRDDLTPNRRAIGATVRVFAGGRWQTRWQSAGSTSMFSGGPARVHVGLGGAAEIDAIEVIWPDGEVARFEGLPVDRGVVVTRVGP